MDIHIDELRMCDGCSEWRHITNFEVGRKYCRVCYAAHMKRLTDLLTKGGAAASELILPTRMSLELPRPIQPDDRVSYTVKDDVPDLTTEELNAMALGTTAEDPSS